MKHKYILLFCLLISKSLLAESIHYKDWYWTQDYANKNFAATENSAGQIHSMACFLKEETCLITVFEKHREVQIPIVSNISENCDLTPFNS
jgi:hypothetical protein